MSETIWRLSRTGYLDFAGITKIGFHIKNISETSEYLFEVKNSLVLFSKKRQLLGIKKEHDMHF